MRRNKIQTSKENFFFANSLVNNKLPSAIPTSRYMDKFEETAEVNFGFFDSASPDYSTYYPDIKAEDLEPKEEDFYTPVVRALSKIILNKYGPIDFSEETVLEDSMNLILRQSLYANHEVMVGNEVGVIADAVWQKTFTDEAGNVIPPGINVRLKIDGKSNVRLIRGMRMDPPSVHSFSVGVTFDWEKSHPKLDESDFWRSLGTFGRDGKLIRRVVTGIQAYHELSLVPHGADPYAQIVSKKGINNAEYAKRMLRFPNKDVDTTKNVFHFSNDDFDKFGHFVDYGKKDFLTLSAEDTTIQKSYNSNNKHKSEHMNELQEFLDSLSQIEALNLSEEDVSQETALAAIKNATKALKAAQGEVETLTASNTQLKTDLETANNTLEAEKPKVEAYEGVLKSTKAEATRLYKLTKGDKASTEMLELIANADSYSAALTFLNQFKKDSEDQFNAKCGDCGSSNVTRMSASSGNQGVLDPDEAEGLDGDDNKSSRKKEKKAADVFADIQKKKSAFNVSGIHGQDEN